MKDLETSHYSGSDKYFRRRLDLLIFPSLLINIYYSAFLFISYRLPLFTGLEQGRLITAISAQVVLLILLPIIGYVVLIPRDLVLGPRRLELLVLIVCTLLVILSATLPVFFWGGSFRSIFSPLMLTFYLMSIVVTRSVRLKVTFALAAAASFALLAKIYDEISINSDVIWLSLTGNQLYVILQTASVVICLYICLYVSLRSWPVESSTPDE
jgi:hypothetical protein